MIFTQIVLLLGALLSVFSDDVTWKSVELAGPKKNPNQKSFSNSEKPTSLTALIRDHRVTLVDGNANGYFDDFFIDRVQVGNLEYLFNGRIQIGTSLLDARPGWDLKSLKYRPLPPQGAFKEFTKPLAFLNEMRGRAGMPPVQLDPELCRGTQLHAIYMTMNRGTLDHYEDASKNGYTEDGHLAATKSLLHLEQDRFESALLSWFMTIYHRVYWFHPHLEAVGMGFQSGNAVLNDRSKYWTKSPRVFEPFPLPYSGQEDAPRSFNAPGEEPFPFDKSIDPRRLGLPISLTFPEGDQFDSVQVTVRGPSSDIAGYVGYPGNPFRADRPGNEDSVIFVPKNILDPRTTYHVSIEALVNDKPFSRHWSFSTK